MNGEKKFRLMILDFDGTLADTFPFMLSIVDQLADKHNMKHMDEADMQLLRGDHPADLMKIHQIPMWKLPILASDAQALMRDNIEHIKLFDGIDQLIRDLSFQGIQIAVVSSNALKNVQQVLGAEIVSLISYFECGVSLFRKSEKLRKILRLSGVPACEALSIGDEIRDIEAAKQAGIPCAAVTWGYASHIALQKYAPEFLMDSVEQIQQVFI